MINFLIVLFILLLFAMYDAHCHLTDDRLFPEWGVYLQNFFSSWGLWLVTVGTDSDSNKKVIALVEDADLSFPDGLIKGTIWYHPYECVVGSLTFATLYARINELYNLYSDHESSIVAVGEAGIDLHYKDAYETLSLQQSCFALQCDLALQLWLPVVVHSRNAFLETMSVLSDFPDLVVYFHCWSYWISELEEVLTVFDYSYFWFCGNISYKGSDSLRKTLSHIPLDRLVLETDSPYLPIQSKRWSTNEPCFITFLYDYLASYLSMERADFSSRVWLNFRSLYQL